MATSRKKSRAASREQLVMQIAAIDRDGGTIVPVEKAPSIVEPEPLVDQSLAEDDAFLRGSPEPFGRWLLAQKDRGDWIDHLADAARRDRGFPRDGTTEDVHGRLVLLEADADVFEQLDDAERCWRSL